MFRTLLADMPEEQRLASMHIVDTRGRVHSAGAAMIVLLSLNKTTRRQAHMARVLPRVRRKIDRQYRELSARRDELSATVPDVESTTVRPRFVHLP